MLVEEYPILLILETVKKDKTFKHVCLGISASGPTKRWDINNYIKLNLIQIRLKLVLGLIDVDDFIFFLIYLLNPNKKNPHF